MQKDEHLKTGIIHYRPIILVVFAIALIVLSFHGALDYCAKEQVDKTTKESIGIYALSRGINAGISVLQSSQVGIGIASIQAGELLDPINDAVERLSSAMVWAIGSLFLQQIVLEVASNPVFKWSFMAIGLVAISALGFVDWERFRNLFSETFKVSEPTLAHYRNLLVRIFIVFAIFRFIVPVFVISSFLVSQMLLETKINEHQKELSSFRKQVSIDVSSSIQESEKADKEIKKLDDEASRISYLPEISLKDLWEKLSSMGKAIYARSQEILDKFRKAGYDRIKEIVDKSSNIVTSITNLLATIVIKNILLPLVFLMIAVKCSLPIFRYSARLASGLRRDSKELQGYLGQGKSEGS